MWVKTITRGSAFLLLFACLKLVFAEEAIDCNVTDLTDAPFTWNHGTWYYTEMYGVNNLNGWHKMPAGNWQIPYKSQINDVCLDYGFIVYLTEDLPAILGEEEKEIQACILQEEVSPNCVLDVTVKIRICDDRIQYYLPYVTWDYLWTPYCFVSSDHTFTSPDLGVQIKPELRFRTENIGGRVANTPSLQFNLGLGVNQTMPVKVNWYVENKLVKQLGPSSVYDDLVLLESDIDTESLGYEVKCGVTKISEIRYAESLSDAFFAGWKVADSISLPKNGFARVALEQTIPIGCHYTGSDTSQCYEELVVEDLSINPGVCAGGIRAQDEEDSKKSSIIVPTLTKGKEWTKKTYWAKLSTIDRNYNDPKKLDVKISLKSPIGSTNNRAVIKKVDVTNNDRHKNKICYSHVDPHHMTSDGVSFEMQKPGDHMLYLNTAFQTEIQQSARYCNARRRNGPVCACGVAIRVGADVFIIDKCLDRSFTFDYVQCKDGGIMDIQRIDDYRYKVRTPIGTIVDITFRWRNTMNIDIYMSAKDYGNVVGLCGNFDGNGANDLLHRDGETVSYDNNRNYMFSDSWILTDEENLFTNKNRILHPWTVFNAKENNQACIQPNSITRKKCDAPRRNNRSRSKRNVELNDLPRHSEFILREKRNEESFTEDEALAICNDTIYTAPAVVEFPDMLAWEDLDMVVQHCVYDLTIGNDSVWADAHREALNNAVETFLELNPAYAANNSDLVKSFLSKKCPHNCNQNGICTDRGICECVGIFRGHDCGSDITIPPVVHEVQGGDVCERSSGDDCTCFVIRTDNTFEGFKCNMRKYKVYFDGTRLMESRKTFDGEYHDIFTGVCCDPLDRKKRSADDSGVQFTLYVFSVSNDGSNFGETHSVYVYDTTCTQHDEVNGNFSVKEDFCFIDGTCVSHGIEMSSADGCFLCDAKVDQYNWSKGYCEGGKDSGMNTAALAGLIIGSIVGVAAVAVLLYLLYRKKTKYQRTIPNTRKGLKNSIDMGLPQKSRPQDIRTSGDNPVYGRASVNTPARQLFRLTVNSKPIFKQNVWETVSVLPNQTMFEDSDRWKEGNNKKVTDGQPHTSDVNIDFNKGYDEVGSLRRTVSGISAISMRSIELI